MKFFEIIKLPIPRSSWNFISFPDNADCPDGAIIFEFTGMGNRSCSTIAEGQRPMSFIFESNTGDELEVYAGGSSNTNCDPNAGRQVFPSGACGGCCTLLAGPPTASFDIINSHQRITIDFKELQMYGSLSGTE
ncbi:hypothetical protein MKX08_002271 [Trichoderma sp. CBMAI-0020]|nr:hypothetical protein MKX08_002271 [Trichoderma sp. CBMAI-0020]